MCQHYDISDNLTYSFCISSFGSHLQNNKDTNFAKSVLKENNEKISFAILYATNLIKFRLFSSLIQLGKPLISYFYIKQKMFF